MGTFQGVFKWKERYYALYMYFKNALSSTPCFLTAYLKTNKKTLNIPIPKRVPKKLNITSFISTIRKVNPFIKPIINCNDSSTIPINKPDIIIFLRDDFKKMVN
jgi:hypothetical protein